MSKQVNYNENLCAGAAIRDDKGRRISKLFEASHPKMTVGYAKNLIMPDTPTEQEFNFRQAGGGVIEDGVAVIDKVKGNSVVWNQRLKMQLAETRTINGITFTKNPYGSITASGTATANATYSIPCDSMVAGHRYLFCASDNGSASTYGFEVANKTGNDVFEFDSNLFNPTIITPSQNGIEGFFALRVWAGATVNVVYRPQSIDLTQMFGAGNEPTTVEEFLQRKPKVEDEFAYNEGTIVNNKVEAVKVQGRNLATSDILLSTDLNEAKFANAFLHRGTYCISLDIPQSITLYVALFDKNGNNISGSASSLGEGWGLSSSGKWWYSAISSGGKLSFSLAKDAIVSIKTNVTLSQTTRIMLNVGTTSLPYESYEEHSLDLSWVKEIKDGEGVKLFEDGMKSVGTAFDEVRKNKAIKRIGIKVFDGTEPLNSFAVKDDQTAVKAEYTFLTTTLEGSRYARVVGAGFYGQYNGGYYYDLWAAGFASIRSLIICLPYSVAKSGTEVKEYLKAQYNAGTPLIVYYELTEPIEVEYDEKNLSYPVVAGGTEEAIASEPSTAFRADIGYGIDAVKTILDLKARVEALEGK